MSNIKILKNPIFFKPNRVWRCYRGGLLLDKFRDRDSVSDSHFPEEWLASITHACNAENSQRPDEGLSVIRGSDNYFADLIEQFPREALGSGKGETGILCKFLDSAVRLPIQCHPDRDFARRYCSSDYGKTEAWIILKTRKINGENPYILLGFKKNIDKNVFLQAVREQDIEKLTGCLHKFHVKPGEIYFIPGRIPHAIGPGNFLLEVQEPTDLVVQPEKQIGETTLSEKQMWGDLDKDTALACFQYRGYYGEEILNKLKLKPEILKSFSQAKLYSVIGAKHTDCFKVEKLNIDGRLEFCHDANWHLAVVTGGEGYISAEDEFRIKKGDSFFISSQINSVTYQTMQDKSLKIYLISSADDC